MTIATQYARALYDLAQESPAKAKQYLGNLRHVLARRGHSKLLPRIYAEYEHLSQKAARAARSSAREPGAERTAQLVDLYRRLIN